MNTAAIFVLFFYGTIISLIYFYVQRKKHSSQPKLKSFLILFLPLIGVLIFWFTLLALIDPPSSTSDFIVNAFFGGIFVSLIISWRWSIDKISQPVPGIEDSREEQSESSNTSDTIPKDQYLSKYKITQAKLDEAMAAKKIEAELIDGQLYIKDEKIK